MTKLDYLNIAIIEKANFFGSAVTEFHLIGILVYADKLINSGINIKGYICIVKHPVNGYLLQEGFLKSYNLELIRVSASNSYKRLTIGRSIQLFYQAFINRFKKNDFFLVKAMYPDIGLIEQYLLNKQIEKRLQLVLVDEGIGTYMSQTYWESVNIAENNNYRKRRFYRTKKLLNDILLLPFFPIQKRFIFKKLPNGMLKKREDIVEGYKYFYMDTYFEIFSIENESVLKKEKLIVFYFSQPMEAYNLFTADQEFQFLKQLIFEFSKENITLYIKPHPRDDITKFKKWGFPIFQSKLPAEQLVLLLHPICVIGFSSTALATSSVFFNTPSYSTIEINAKILNNSELMEGVKHYKTLLKEYVYFPEDISTLVELCVLDNRKGM